MMESHKVRKARIKDFKVLIFATKLKKLDSLELDLPGLRVHFFVLYYNLVTNCDPLHKESKINQSKEYFRFAINEI